MKKYITKRISQVRFATISLIGSLVFLIPAPGAATTLNGCDAIAGNLVKDCGFEAGDFSRWTQGGNTNGTYVVSNFDGFLPNSGAEFAALGATGTDGVLSQALATNLGDSYTISWYLASDGEIPNDFSATWGAKTIFFQTNLANPNYTLYSFTQVATTASTTLTFQFGSEPGYLALDDTSVIDNSAALSGVPEPSSILLLALGIAIFAWRMIRAPRKTLS